jgi:hypothetical protein
MVTDRGRSVAALETAGLLGRSRDRLRNPEVDGPAAPRSDRGVYVLD